MGRFKIKKGFTIVEFLISVAIISILLVTVIVFINPAEQMRISRDDQREVHLGSIWHAVEHKIYRDRGWEDCAPIPTSTATFIGSEYYDLYPCLYPDFIQDTVFDPTEGFFNNMGDYYTHYKIGYATSTNEIVLEAPGSETRSVAIGEVEEVEEEQEEEENGNGFVECGDNVTFTYNGETVTYRTVETGGNCWMDRNLGAVSYDEEDATTHEPSSNTDSDFYGDLFQWGRAPDGHQLIDRDAGVPISDNYDGDTEGYATTYEPNTGEDWDGKFIMNDDSDTNRDWLDDAHQNNDLWKDENGTILNNPCLAGWRVPSEEEFNAMCAETAGADNCGDWSNATDAWESDLKLVLGGVRLRGTGSLSVVGSFGRLWSSLGRLLSFSSSGANMYSGYRASGFSVRCLKG